MGRPDVDRMMASMTAREYREWQAYERATGPIDARYEREMIVSLNELLQVNNLLTGAQVTKKGRRNPAGKFRKMPLPGQYFDPNWDAEPDEDDFDEDDIDYGDFDEEYESPKKKGDGGYDPAKDPFAPPP